MKNIILTISLILLSLSIYGQNEEKENAYSFEAGTGNWNAEKGDVSINSELYKDGKQSLKWKSEANDILTAAAKSFSINSQNAASFYIYCDTITNDTLYIDFYNGNEKVRTARLLLNFNGWRTFYRAYSDYANKNNSKVDRITFTRKSNDNKVLDIYFDQVNFNRDIDKNYLVGYHMLPDREYIKTGCELLDIYANLIDIPSKPLTNEEKEALTVLYPKNTLPYKKATDAQLEKAREFIDLHITKNENGKMVGNPINTMDRISREDMLKYTNPLAYLASSPADKDRCQLYIDYLLQQGIAESVNHKIVYSDYEMVRTLPLTLFAAVQVAREDQKPELLKFIRWITEYGRLYYSDPEYLSTMNADIVTNYLQYYFAFALVQPTEPDKARELKAFKRFLERQTAYTKGDLGILKPDGTGFHHRSHYNNYMYAFRNWIGFAYRLKGTPFRIGQDAYDRMSKAVVSMYLMSGRDENDNRFTANSLSGRNPYYRSGAKIQVYKSEFKQLIEVGGDIQGKAFDSLLAGAYNYFFMTDEYAVPTTDLNGFFQFNYSPIGVYRSNDWVVTMRCPTTRFWGSEIYNKTNRLGRYQSHGTLEIVYNGGLTASGLPALENSGGWDWNVIPGTTTVHYTSWTEMMPAGNVSQRFDQYAKTKDFSGALAWGNTGMFAADFDQSDRWSKENFEPTNLTFKKSVYAFDGMLISIGSNIGAEGNYADDMITATNLFQEIKSNKSGTMSLNGEAITETGFDKKLDTGKVNWILTPMSTGYIIPAGNEAVTVKYASQKTPKQTGEDAADPKASLTAAKAYIDHGVKTKDKKYSFIVVPKASVEQLKTLSGSLNKLYKVNYQDSLVHAITYLPQKIQAYTFFGKANNLKGLVKASDTELLLMLKEEGKNTYSFAVCNPNLRATSDPEFRWVSNPTEACITLTGKWSNIDDTIRMEYDGNDTKVYFTVSEGMPLYFSLKKDK